MTTDTTALQERVADTVRQALDEGEAMQCTRVWEAWRYGTMTEEDFTDASDGPLAEEVAAAVLSTVVEEVRKAKAEALREAAQEFALSPFISYSGQHVQERLHSRADRVEAGGSDEHR